MAKKVFTGQDANKIRYALNGLNAVHDRDAMAVLAASGIKHTQKISTIQTVFNPVDATIIAAYIAVKLALENALNAVAP